MFDDFITIRGEAPSKSNSYKIITLANHGSLAKQPKLKEYENSFYLQCPMRDRMIKNLFELWIDVYFTSITHDLDNSLKIVLDCLQQCRTIKNDNLCVKIVARKFVDKANPRIEFKIVEQCDDD